LRGFLFSLSGGMFDEHGDFRTPQNILNIIIAYSILLLGPWSFFLVVFRVVSTKYFFLLIHFWTPLTVLAPDSKVLIMHKYL